MSTKTKVNISTQIDSLEQDVRSALHDLTEGSALNYIDNFCQELQDLSFEASTLRDEEGVDDEQYNRLVDLEDALNVASVAVEAISEQFTEAHQALSGLFS